MNRETAQHRRIRSIDVFRGLTILLMIFVNDVAGVRNIPAWLKHAPEGAPGMTAVDIVFPAFLFIVGLAIPFALARRRKKYPGRSLWPHVFLRTGSLLLIGLLMLNGPAVTSMHKAWWNVLMYAAVILFWTGYPGGENRKPFHSVLKWSGLALLLFLLIVYRRGSGDDLTWIKTGWWGILGEIGFAYFLSAAAFLLLEKRPHLLLTVPAFCVLLYIADRSGQLDFLGGIRDIFYIGSHFGMHTLITVSGLICGRWIYSLKDRDHRQLMINMGVLALSLALGGYFLYGLYGIDKIAATPSWAMYSTSVCILFFMLIYGFMDTGGKSSGYAFFRPVAVNPLLAYLLHVMFIYVFQLIGISAFYSGELGAGIVGILRSLLYTLFIYYVTRLLTNAGVRLKL